MSTISTPRDLARGAKHGNLAKFGSSQTAKGDAVPDDQDARRQAARERGAAVLADLMAQAGVSSSAELARRSELAGVKISDQTVSNLLSAKVTARDATVLKFVTACLHDQVGNERLVAERAAAAFWKARFDDALGRAGVQAGGLVRIGQPPPEPKVFVDRPDLVVLATAGEAGESVVLVPSDQVGASADGPIDVEPDRGCANGPRRLDGERSRVLSGLGGVGKSQLAAQYARRVWLDPSLDLLVWVSARNVDSVISAYAQAAVELVGAEASRPEQAAQRLMAWLSTTTRSWLIVLDDVQLPKQVQPWWPEPTESGQVIVTTRYRGESLHRPGRNVVEVGIYTPKQARSYLQRRLTAAPHLCQDPDGQLEPADVVDGLANDLGRLPLAMTHAATYLLQEDVPVREYQALLTDYRTRLDSLFPHHEELPDEYLDTVTTTWQISMDLATRLAPGGVVAVVMKLASLLDPDGIPRDVFVTDAVMTYLGGVLGRVVLEREVSSAIQVLHRLSLLTHDRHNPHYGVQVHALVQRATREEHGCTADTPDTPDTAATRAAADAVLEIWPEIERDTALVAALRSNTRVLYAAVEPALWTPSGHGVMFRAGRSLYEAGLVNDAITYYQQLLAAARTRLGPDDPNTLSIRGNLASCRRDAGDPAGAATDLSELLNDCMRLLGPDHPSILIIRGNLAGCRQDAGDFPRAATDFAELLDDHMRLLGPGHPTTLATRGHLAGCRQDAGDLIGAVAAYAELLDDCLSALGSDHPHTLATRGGLATCRQDGGDLAGAVAAYAELLDDCVRVLGPDHRDVLTIRGRLASCRRDTGDSASAVSEFAELLGDRVRVLGPDHPHTLTIRGHLATCRRDAGDLAGAAIAYTELLDDCVRVLGSDHHDTLITRGNLATCRRDAGDPAGAVVELAELLDDRVRVLGSDHPETLNTRGHLAGCRQDAGDFAGAVTEFADLLDDCVRVLGPDHPDTLAIRGNLAHCRGLAGDPSGAASDLAELLSTRMRVLRPDQSRINAVKAAQDYWMARANESAS